MIRFKERSARPNPTLLWILAMLIATIISVSSCKQDSDVPEPNNDTEIKHPSLKIVNDLKEDWRPIISVNLVGYDFTNLNIEYNGDSQRFNLDKGMPGGYDNVNVSVTFIRYAAAPRVTLKIKVDFVDGKTTTISLRDCVDSSGQCLY